MGTTSQRILTAMELRGFKQADLVEKTGISKGALSSYISGRYTPKQNNIYLIAKALDVNEAWLIGADVPMERQLDPVLAPAPLPADQKQLNDIYTQLDSSNKKKVITYATNLLSTQRMEDELIPDAAHAFTPTEEEKKHADSIMKDDKEW